MKVVHLIHRYPPTIGGAEAWLQALARRLSAQHGILSEVHTFALHDVDGDWRALVPGERAGAFGPRQLDGDVEVLRHPVSVPGTLLRAAFKRLDRYLGWYLYGPHSIGMLRALPRAIRDADLVHVHTHPYTHVLIGLWLARRLGKPTVVTPHFHPAMPKHLARRSLRALGTADRILAVTEHERDALVAHGLPAERIVVTGNGVDLERFRALAALEPAPHLDLARAPGTSRVAFLGRKVEYKGLDVLVAALREVRRRRPVELLLVGPGTTWSEGFLASLPESERAWIRDLGPLDEADKVAALRSCDLLAQPSPHEAFGIVFLEAWACGLPVVGADSGAIASVIERGGLVFPPGDAGALASAVQRLLDEPRTARACAARGLERVEERFDWDRLASQVAGVYRELLPRPRRVLVVSALYPPRSFGGAEVMARTGAVGLARRGLEVQVFGTYRDQRRPRWKGSVHADEGTRVHYYPVRNEDNFPAYARHHRVPESEEAFRRLLREWRPDVVHFHNIQTLSHRLIDLAEDAGIATVMTLHDYWPICFKHIRVLNDGRECPRNGFACLACRSALIDAPDEGMLDRNATVRGSFDRLRLLLTPAHYLGERYVENGVPRERLRHHPYGIDLAPLRRIADARRPRRPLRLGFLGYIGPHKGVFVLAEAAAKLRGDFRLLVYGAGEGEQELARRVRPLGERVELRGPVAHDAVASAFAELDVLVLPSLWPDNFPVSILEALASGAVVVASAAGGMQEQVLPEENGLLVPMGDADALARALQRLVDDPELVARLSAGAVRSSERYSLELYLDRLEGFYTEALHGRSSRKRTRPLVVHSGLHSDAGTRVLYDALGKLSAAGLEVEPLALRFARDEDVEQAVAVVLTRDAEDAAELALRAAAYERAVLAPANDPRARRLLECAHAGSTYAGATDLAARVRVLVDGVAAPELESAETALEGLLERSWSAGGPR